MKPVRETKQHLLQQKEALERRIRLIRGDYGRELSANPEERAAELENSEVQEYLYQSAHEELATINRKLRAFAIEEMD